MTELESEKIFKKPLTCPFVVDDVTHKNVTRISLLFLWGRMICVTGSRGYQVTELNKKNKTKQQSVSGRLRDLAQVTVSPPPPVFPTWLVKAQP